MSASSPPPRPIDSPLVSVCIPVYNGGACLKEAVQSVLAQTFTDMEVLVFDDASVDGCLDTLADLDDPRLKVHRNPTNLGPAMNWNQAVRAGRGIFIKLFHQDDRLLPDCIERQVEALGRAPGCSYAFCGRRIVRPDGRVFMTRRPPWRAGVVAGRSIVKACLRLGTNLVGEPSAVLFRRSAAEAIGGFRDDLAYVIDLDYWVRLLTQGDAVCIPEPLADFRVSARQWSFRIGKKQSSQFIAYAEELGALGLFQVRWLDVWTARCMARVQGLLRRIVQRVMLRG